LGSSETKRDAPGIYQGDDIVRSYIERYKVLGGLFGLKYDSLIFKTLAFPCFNEYK